MGQNEADLPVSGERLEKIRRYVAGQLHLFPEGQNLAVDEKALEGLLPHALIFSPYIKRRKIFWKEEEKGPPVAGKTCTA